MKCEKFSDILIHLDNNEKLDIRARMHMLFCKNCKALYVYYSSKINLLKNESSFRTVSPQADMIMRRIYYLTKEQVKDFSTVKWLIPILIFVLGMIIVSLSDNYSLLIQNFGQSYELPFFIVLGTMISIYVTLYIGLHISSMKEAFVKSKFYEKIH